MYDYEYWFDSEGKMHRIAEMDEGYILNCLNQLDKMLSAWHGIVPEHLTSEELKLKDKVGMKAWFVLHGINYIDVFTNELEKRKNNDEDSSL